jgi:hypothetical protein
MRAMRRGTPIRHLGSRKVLGLGLGAWLVFSLVGCGPGSPPGEGYELIGFVVEARGGERGPPIAGATVRFEADTGRVSEDVSESDGRYRLFVVSDVRFGQVTARAGGFGEARQTVFFDAPSRRLDLALPRDGAMPGR